MDIEESNVTTSESNSSSPIINLKPDTEYVHQSSTSGANYFYFDIAKRPRSIVVEAWSHADAADPDLYISVGNKFKVDQY